MTVALAQAACRAETGPFRDLRFSTDEIREIRYASLLHDFGKVGVREDVLVKAKKLAPLHLELIRQRAEILKRGLELRYAKQKLGRLLRGAREGFGRRSRRNPQHRSLGLRGPLGREPHHHLGRGGRDPLDHARESDA